MAVGAASRHVKKIQGGNESMKAEEIFDMINNNLVTRSAGINLIENYGLRHERCAVRKLLEDFPASQYTEIEKGIEKISAKLDGLLKKITGEEN